MLSLLLTDRDPDQTPQVPWGHGCMGGGREKGTMCEQRASQVNWESSVSLITLKRG